MPQQFQQESVLVEVSRWLLSLLHGVKPVMHQAKLRRDLLRSKGVAVLYCIPNPAMSSVSAIHNDKA